LHRFNPLTPDKYDLIAPDLPMLDIDQPAGTNDSQLLSAGGDRTDSERRHGEP
jgi:hypothetical protein